MKDLNKLGRDLKDVILVDNSQVCYMYNNDNGLPIKTWTTDPFDRELFNLMPLLDFLADVNDVREYINKMASENNYTVENAMKVKSIPEINPQMIKEPNDIPEQKTKSVKNNVKIIMCRDSINCYENKNKNAQSNNDTSISQIKNHVVSPSEISINAKSAFANKGNNVQFIPAKLIKINNPSLPKLIYDAKSMITDKHYNPPHNNTTTNNIETEKESYLKILSNDYTIIQNNYITSPKSTVSSLINTELSKKHKESLSNKIIPKYKKVMDYQKNSEDISKMYFRHFNSSSKRIIIFNDNSINLDITNKLNKNPAFESFFLRKCFPNGRGKSTSSINNSNNNGKSILIKPCFINNCYKIA